MTTPRPVAPISLADLLLAYDCVSAGGLDENHAYLDPNTGCVKQPMDLGPDEFSAAKVNEAVVSSGAMRFLIVALHGMPQIAGYEFFCVVFARTTPLAARKIIVTHSRLTVSLVHHKVYNKRGGQHAIAIRIIRAQ